LTTKVFYRNEAFLSRKTGQIPCQNSYTKTAFRAKNRAKTYTILKHIVISLSKAIAYFSDLPKKRADHPPKSKKTTTRFPKAGRLFAFFITFCTKTGTAPSAQR
jgi:hypothetical protein